MSRALLGALMLAGATHDGPWPEPRGRKPLKAPSSLWGPRVDSYRPKRPTTDEDRRRLAAAEAKRARRNQRRKAAVRERAP